MPKLECITINPLVMGGKPCIRGLRVTVGTIVGLLAAGKSREEILRIYPYLEGPDIDAAMEYAAWRVEENSLACKTLRQFAPELETDALVTVDEARQRVRVLPITQFR